MLRAVVLQKQHSWKKLGKRRAKALEEATERAAADLERKLEMQAQAFGREQRQLLGRLRLEKDRLAVKVAEVMQAERALEEEGRSLKLPGRNWSVECLFRCATCRTD